MAITADIAVAWASGDAATLAEWRAPDCRWTLAGGPADEEPGPPFVPERVVVLSVVTHGRLAACDGVLERGAEHADFSHMIRFTNTVKTGKIAEARTYLAH